MQRVSLLMKLAGDIMGMVGPASPIGQDMAKIVTMLGKHARPGDVSPAGENNQLNALRMKQMQMAPQLAALRAQGGPPPSGGAPPQGAPPPMPPQA